MPPIEEALCPDYGREFGLPNLQSDLSLMPQILGRIDRGHPALADLTLDSVAALEGRV